MHRGTPRPPPRRSAGRAGIRPQRATSNDCRHGGRTDGLDRRSAYPGNGHPASISLLQPHIPTHPSHHVARTSCHTRHSPPLARHGLVERRLRGSGRQLCGLVAHQRRHHDGLPDGILWLRYALGHHSVQELDRHDRSARTTVRSYRLSGGDRLAETACQCRIGKRTVAVRRL